VVESAHLVRFRKQKIHFELCFSFPQMRGLSKRSKNLANLFQYSNYRQKS
jgi:hypothetical protein